MGSVEISEKLTLSRGLNVKKEPSWQRSLRSTFQVDAKAPSPEVLVIVRILKDWCVPESKQGKINSQSYL